MNLLSLILLVYSSCICKEASITIIEGETKAEVFNSIDNFNQYHSSGFKVNLFRSRAFSDEEGNKVVNYIFGVDNYGGASQVYQVGSFIEPQIIDVHNKLTSLKLEIEHGHLGHRSTSLITVTKEKLAIGTSL